MGEILGIFSVPVLIGASVIYFLVKRYRRCPSNKILVIYGRSSHFRLLFFSTIKCHTYEP
jgi:uncharacterized membrane protein YqiK